MFFFFLLSITHIWTAPATSTTPSYPNVLDPFKKQIILCQDKTGHGLVIGIRINPETGCPKSESQSQFFFGRLRLLLSGAGSGKKIPRAASKQVGSKTLVTW